jgi:hypothetical protein
LLARGARFLYKHGSPVSPTQLPLRLIAQAYPSQRRFRILVPALAAALAAVLVAVLGQSPGHAQLLPFAGLPVLAIWLWFVFGARLRRVELVLDAGTLSIVGWGSRPLGGRIEQVEPMAWTLPGVGSTHGAALRIGWAPGTPNTIVIAAAGQPLPGARAGSRRGHSSTQSPDCFVTGEDFQALVRALGLAKSDLWDGAASELRLILVRHTGLSGAFGPMLPWLGTMAFLSLFGVLFGEKLMLSPWGMPFVGIVSVAAIALGIRSTWRRSLREKPKYTLHVTPQELSLADPNGELLWSEILSRLTSREETYVYRTKYATHRFPVLALSGSKGQKLRLGVWDSSAELAFTGSTEGRAPHYLVGTPDWPFLLKALASGG